MPSRQTRAPLSDEYPAHETSQSPPEAPFGLFPLLVDHRPRLRLARSERLALALLVDHQSRLRSDRLALACPRHPRIVPCQGVRERLRPDARHDDRLAMPAQLLHRPRDDRVHDGRLPQRRARDAQDIPPAPTQP